MTWPAPHPNTRISGLPFREMQHHGLLWLINSAVFHPRGYALAFNVTTDGNNNVQGWCMQGDGTEPYLMPGDETDDRLFAAAETFLASLKPEVAA